MAEAPQGRIDGVRSAGLTGRHVFEHVRLVCFDLDDTLWPCAPVIRAAEQRCYDWLARHAPRVTARYQPDELRAHRIALMKTQPRIAHDLGEVRRRSLAQILDAVGYPSTLAEAAYDAFRVQRNRVTPYPDVIDALARMREHYTLVSVTNGNAQIEHTPLRASFDLSLTAADVGAAKPDPAIFHVASRLSGVGLDEFLHVGDDPERDVDAARRIGLVTVWVNRNEMAWPGRLPRANLEVCTLDELTGVLLGPTRD